MARGDIFTLEQLQQAGIVPATQSSTSNPSFATEDTPETEQSVVSQQPPSRPLTHGESFRRSIINPAVGVISGFAQLGRPLQQLAGKGIEAVTGMDMPDATKEAAEKTARETLGVDTESFGFKAGRFGGETLPYFMTGGQAGVATKGMGIFTRTLAQAIPAGTVSSLQRGKVDDETLMTAALAGATVPAGDLLKATGNVLSKSLPEWLVRPLVKQSAQAKQQGKDIVPFLLEKGRVGSVDSLAQQSDDSMRALNTQINTTLQQSNKTVNFAGIAQDVADDFNLAGGQTTADEVLAAVQRQAFEARGSLGSVDDVGLATANSVRSQLDDTLYSGRDYLRQALPENKAILEAFTNKLRGTVQQLEPSTRPLFSEYSKEITLKKALESAASASNGRLSVGLGDLVTGGGVFTATGDPITTALAIGGRRAFETPQVKTALAKVFTNTGPVIDALETASPAVRATFIKFMDDVLNKQSSQESQGATAQ